MRALSVLVALIGVALLAAGVADAHKIKYVTKAKLTSGGPTGASGRVSCTTKGCPKACKAKRKVTLFRDNETGGPDQKFGITMTRSTGDFRVDASLLAGDYYVVVASRQIVANAVHTHLCRAATSVSMRF